MLVTQAHTGSKSRVPLLARRLNVRGRHLVDVFLDRAQPGRLSYHRFSLGRNRVPDRLTHHPPVHTMLLGQSLNRLSGRVSPPDQIVRISASCPSRIFTSGFVQVGQFR